MISTVPAFSPPLIPQLTGRFRDDTDAIRHYLVRSYLPYVFSWLGNFTNFWNTGPQGFGKDIVSASSINFTSFAHVVTGTATINTINVPTAGVNFAGQLVLVSRDGFSLGTGGNIGAAKTVTAGMAIWLVYSQVEQTWYPAL